jgi:hypothetical protein
MISISQIASILRNCFLVRLLPLDTSVKSNTHSLPLCVKIVLGKKIKDVAHFFALKAQKNEQRPKGIFLSTLFERSGKE